MGSSIPDYDTKADIHNGTGPYLGIYPEFFHSISLAGNFTLQYSTVSGGSREKTTSAWTACVIDVQMDLLDLCVGLFWITAERLDMTAFSVPMGTDKFYLMVKMPKLDHSIATNARRVFMPFSSELWLVLGAGIVLVSITRIVQRLISADCRGRSRRSIEAVVADAFYSTSMELASDSTNYGENDDCAKRLMNIGWGAFILLVVASFTANLTAFLVKSDLNFPIRNIDDCISRRCKLCVGEVQLADMKALYGTNILYVPNDAGHRWALEELKQDKCEAAVIPSDWYASYKDAQEESLIFTGSVLLSYHIGFPVRPQFQAAVSNAMRSLDTTADSKVLADLRKSYYGSMESNPWRDPSDETEQVPRLTPEHMLGPILILAAFAGLTLFVECVQVFSTRCCVSNAGPRSREEAEVADAEGVSATVEL
jgi:hypothetical protein